MKGIRFANDGNESGSALKVILKNKRAMLSYTYYGLSTLFLSSMETLLSDRLMDRFNFTSDEVAIHFFLFCGGALTSSLVSALFLRETDKGLVILVSLFLCSFSFLLIGPSVVLRIPVTSGIVGFGLFIGGAQNLIPNYAASQVLKFTKRQVSE